MFIVCTLVLVVACGDVPETPVGRHVSKAGFEAAGLRWPLTVEQGVIGCDNEARWFEVNGTKYGVNGTASEERGYTAIEPIWSADEKMMRELKAAGIDDAPPIRVNIGDMINEAGKLCT